MQLQRRAGVRVDPARTGRVDDLLREAAHAHALLHCALGDAEPGRDLPDGRAFADELAEYAGPACTQAPCSHSSFRCSPRPASSAEVRSATWDEVDLEAAVWTISARRTKAGREHRVPLSDRALAVLHEARCELSQYGDLVFPSLRKGRMQGCHPMGKLMKTQNTAVMPHGFISSFRDLAAECTNAPREVCELVLEHVNNDRVKAV